MDEDGQPRKARAGEDPHNIGLSLEYVFNSFATAADYVHVSAQQCLGEQSLPSSFKLRCDLPRSTSQPTTANKASGAANEAQVWDPHRGRPLQLFH